MASNTMPQASHALSCPLLKLPPELRLLIYAYTHSIDLDLEYYYVHDFEDLSEAWTYTPLVKLASTCRLIAKEARGYVRSMPESQREVLVELLAPDGPKRNLATRLHQVPCPTVDLRGVVVSFDLEKYKSTAHAFPADHHDSGALDGAMHALGLKLYGAVCLLMTEASVNDTIYWKAPFWLQINGLRPKKEGESSYDAVRRVLNQPTTDPASAERLVREFYSWTSDDGWLTRNASDHQLAAYSDIPLYLLV
jgi:hypothetical protein